MKFKPKLARRPPSMADRFDELALILLVHVDDLYSALPSAEERADFRECFPETFYEVCWFGWRESDTWPASITYDDSVFSRPNFTTWLARQAPAKIAFDPPDVRGLKWFGVHELALARGRWWIANHWPVTTNEREWTWTNLRELFPALKHCPKDEADESKTEETNGPVRAT